MLRSLTFFYPALPQSGPEKVAFRPISTKILDFPRVWLKQNLTLKGWHSHVHRKFPGKCESNNLSRSNLSREIGLNFPSGLPQDDPSDGTSKVKFRPPAGLGPASLSLSLSLSSSLSLSLPLRTGIVGSTVRHTQRARGDWFHAVYAASLPCVGSASPCSWGCDLLHPGLNTVMHKETQYSTEMHKQCPMGSSSC